jgi:hypothetical protein
VISCGDRIEGTTEGGSNQIEGEVYEDSYCFVPFENYDGPERAYELMLPEYTFATIYYSFPCQDMAIAAFRWAPDECPTLAARPPSCVKATAWAARARWRSATSSKRSGFGRGGRPERHRGALRPACGV